jgi:nucleoid-associated protein YgaU
MHAKDLLEQYGAKPAILSDAELAELTEGLMKRIRALPDVLDVPPARVEPVPRAPTNNADAAKPPSKMKGSTRVILACAVAAACAGSIYGTVRVLANETVFPSESGSDKDASGVQPAAGVPSPSSPPMKTREPIAPEGEPVPDTQDGEPEPIVRSTGPSEKIEVRPALAEAPTVAILDSGLPIRSYTVQHGDTLTAIALAELRSASQWQEIWELNKAQVPNPDFLPIGTRLILPDRKAAPAQTRSMDKMSAASRPNSGPRGKPRHTTTLTAAQ